MAMKKAAKKAPAKKGGNGNLAPAFGKKAPAKPAKPGKPKPF